MSLLDKLNQPIDFSVGSWRADLYIVEYPGDESAPFAHLTTEVGEAGTLRWLSLESSSLILTPDPLITDGWNFHKFHFDLYIKGPNANSKTERVDHGPFRLDV